MNVVLPTGLLLDASLPQCRFLRVWLREGSLYNEAGQMLADLSSITQQSPDAIIVEIGIPHQTGWGLVQELSEWFTGPVIIITNTPPEMPHSAAAPATSGTHPISKDSTPIAAAEYQARTHVLQRLTRLQSSLPPVFQIEDLRVDFEERLVTLQGREVRLTPSEFRLLKLLIQHAGKVLTHAFLLEAVWGAERTDDLQSLRVYMSTLRRKIELDPAHPRYLMTIQSIGYRLNKP